MQDFIEEKEEPAEEIPEEQPSEQPEEKDIDDSITEIEINRLTQQNKTPKE